MEEDYKIIEMTLERVKPVTAAAMLLMLKLPCPAPNYGNAVLKACVLKSTNSWLPMTDF
jgi:hypothetical protein